jgi:hypothetical protein
MSAEARKRVALALQSLHQIQQLHVASRPRGQPVAFDRLRRDDGQVV